MGRSCVFQVENIIPAAEDLGRDVRSSIVVRRVRS